MTAPEVLISGKASFSQQVPYRLYRSGNEKKGPLFVYLHQDGSNIENLDLQTQSIRTIDGYHLYIQAPFEDPAGPGAEKSCHWIISNTDQTATDAQREYVSEFIQEVIDQLLPYISGSRLVLLGWSGSVHQVSHFCSTRPHYVNELILFDTTLDRSWWQESSGSRYAHMRVLTLTGKDARISDKLARIIASWLNNDQQGRPV